MKMRILSVACGALLLILGCVPSLHPLYTDEDVLFDRALVGTWSQQNSQDMWTFSKEGEKRYRLVYANKNGIKGEFVVHLLKVEETLFLDLFPDKPEPGGNDFYKSHILRAHTFMQVKEIAPTLRMAPMNPEWLGKLLEKTPAAIQHEKVDNRIVLTASPKQLQAFVIKHKQTEKAWGDYSEMKRQRKK